MLRFISRTKPASLTFRGIIGITIVVVAMWKDFRNNTPENGDSTLDHEKPQAVNTYADETAYVEDRTVSPMTVDVDYARHPSLDEPVIIEDRKEQRGESLW